MACLKGGLFSHYGDKVDGNDVGFGGSDHLCNFLLDVVGNLQIITRLRRRF